MMGSVIGDEEKARLAGWLSGALGGERLLEVRRLSGGNSNATFELLTDAGRRVLRRPPEASLDPSAHSMEREHRVLGALAGTGVPAPRPLALCAEAHVIGAPFLVMEHVAGLSLTDSLPPGWDEAQVGEAGLATVEALARLHTVRWQEVGLADFGRPEGFLERQVGRWRRQYEAHRVRELPRFEQVATWLDEHRPEAGEPAIVHGDFHVDNCLLAAEPPTRVTAIIDWEMSTIGDPLLDLGLMLAFWGPERPSPRAMPRIQGFSLTTSAPSRAALAARYAELTGRSVEHLHYYLALAFWKLGAIVEGAYAQHLAGKADTDYARALEQDVPLLFEEAAGFAGIA